MDLGEEYHRGDLSLLQQGVYVLSLLVEFTLDHFMKVVSARSEVSPSHTLFIRN